VHVFGNSLGGAVAALVAASRPDLVRSLTLIAPALPNFRPSATAVRIPILLVPGVREVILRRLAATPAEERVRLAVAATYANPDLVHPQRLRDAAAEIRRRAELPYAEEALVRSTRGLIASYASAGTRNLWQVARRVVSPTLLIFGTHDKLVDFRLAARASRTFRNSRLVVLPDVGHVAQMERPSVVGAAVRDFLAALDAGRTSESGNPEHGDRV
jgi:pimeloyl-ACP methyl ester carboxylesterase